MDQNSTIKISQRFDDIKAPNPSDRVLVLKVKDGKAPLTSTGLVDNRLFSGENNLHGVMDPQSCLWSFKYEMGGLPPALKDQKFTSFSVLKRYAEEYFKKRNIEIVEVKFANA